MANDRQRYENQSTNEPDMTTGIGSPSGSSLKQGLHGNTERTQERGRDEFVGHGDAAELDEGRTEIAGRHYGRSGDEEPGPGYGRGPLQPDEGTVAYPENHGVDYDNLRRPTGNEAPSRTQGRHGQAPFAQGRDAGLRKQMLPSDKASVEKSKK